MTDHQSIYSSNGCSEGVLKLDVGKMVDYMTRESCIPTDSVESGDDCPFLFIVLRLGHILIRIRPTRHTRLVKVMICWVGNIRVKRGQGEIWITICI